MPLLILYVEWMRAGIIGASCIIWTFAPVNHPNLQMREEEFMYSKKSARLELILELHCFLCVLKTIGKVAELESNSIDNKWPPICIGLIHQPKRPKQEKQIDSYVKVLKYFEGEAKS